MADQIQKIITDTQGQIVDLFLELSKEMTTAEAVQVIDKLDISKIIEPAQQKIRNTMLSGYIAELQGLQVGGIVTEEVLQSFVNVQTATFLSEIGDIGEVVRRETISGILQKLPVEDIITNIGAKGLRPDQIQTLVDTSLQTFSRQVTALQAESLPENQKYVYIGPVDEKTRDICIEMMSAGELTQNEIESSYPGAFIDGGGFNCRHTWRRVVSGKKNKFHDPARAGLFKAERGDKFNPQTLLEQTSAK